MYIYSIWALNHGHYPYKWLWTYAGDKFFEGEGEIKFIPVYAHDLLLLINYSPSVEKYVKLMKGSYSSMIITLTDQNSNPINFIDPNILITLLFKSHKK